VQIGPETANPAFAFCYLTLTEAGYPWGVQGFVQALGTPDAPGEQAYYRCEWDEVEFVGRSAWVIEQHDDR
jgi:hypothetical protein